MEAHSLSDTVITFIRDHREWAAPIVFVLALGESLAFISLILPFWIMLVTIGTLLGMLGLDFWTIWIAASLGAAAGDWLSFWLGGRFKTRIRHVWPLSRYPKILPIASIFFRRFGWMAIVAARFSGPLRAAVPLVAGMSRMPFWRFQAANVGSAFLWAGVLLAPGSLFGWAMPWLQSVPWLKDWLT
jgi:membrane protein DedA with SNARE-associated domain